MSEMVAADVVLYALAAIMACVAGAWAYLLKSMTATFRRAPYLDEEVGAAAGAGNTDDNTARDRAPGADHAVGGGGTSGKYAPQAAAHAAPQPMVSVILPARNEEDYIERCLESLAVQDYPNYEIVAIDDSSDDATRQIIARCARNHPGVIVPVAARPKPDGWMGKNWACMEGYRKAKGDLLLFTDADTHHAESVITLAVRHLLANRLDALTVMPRMQAPDFWIKTTLPMISVFLHTKFSVLNVNSPSSKTGYFFGSFFILRKETYRAVGTHESVREEMIEDGALGRKTKEAGHRMRMVRGEHLIEAVWARDGRTLWNALKRLTIPLRTRGGLAPAAGIAAVMVFLLVAPFALLGVAGVRVRVGIYDLSGRLVRSLLDNQLDQEIYAISWDGKLDDDRLAMPGLYACRVQVETHAGPVEKLRIIAVAY